MTTNTCITQLDKINQQKMADDSLQQIADDFINELEKKSLDAIRTATGLDESDVFSKQSDWVPEEGIALHFYCKRWDSNTHIALLFTTTGTFRVQFYGHGASDPRNFKFRAAINAEKSNIFERGQCVSYFDSFDLATALQEIQDVAWMLDSVFHLNNYAMQGR
jgi:hypothetical protein